MDRPPQLAALTVGQKVRVGPFIKTATEQMARDRERINEDIARRWEREQERQRHREHSPNEYFADFKQSKMRRRFVRRVFGLVTLQLLFTAAMIATVLMLKEVRSFAIENPRFWKIALLVWFVSYGSIVFSDCARQSPCNIVCLILMTVSMAYTGAVMSLLYSTRAVVLTAGTTALLTLTITCLATCSKFDLTEHTVYLMFVCIVAFLTVLILVLMKWLGYADFSKLDLIFGIVGSVVWSLLLFYDLQMIMGGRTLVVEPDDVVYPAARMYVDLILLYKFLLAIFACCFCCGH